jgi:uncharacterized DUF497 family protein
MEIESDPIKATLNLKKHGISFSEAATTLYDTAALVQEDNDSKGESRWVLVGLSNEARLLTVVYTLRNKGIIRLISARKATKKETKYYA